VKTSLILNIENTIPIVNHNFGKTKQLILDREYSSLNHALLLLLDEIHREINSIPARINNLTLVSLSVRNIFKLYLIVHHVMADENHLNSWYGQIHRDSKEIKDGMITLMEKKGLDAAELKTIQDSEDFAISKTSFKSSRQFNIKVLAEKYKYKDHYNFLYKLTSKLIHPSAIKIMGYDSINKNDNYLSMTLQLCDYFIHEVNELLFFILKQDT
jgi:hypothetical protein